MYKISFTNIVIILVCLMFLPSGCKENTSKDEKRVTKGKYIGEISAGNDPAIFASGLISTNLSERDVAITPDGKEFYYTLWTGAYGVILFTKENESGWSDPEIVPFSKEYSNLEPFITQDRNRLYFVSNRPLESGGKIKDYDIWYVERTDSGWSLPINIGKPVNSEVDEFYPSVAANGNIYFTSARDESYGSEDIFLCEYKDGKYSNPENLGLAVNSKTDEFNAFVAPDESFIIFSNWGREDGLGGGDLYISFKDDNGEWQPSKNLGENINSSSLDFCPYVTRDGKYFFFTSRRVSEKLNNQTLDNYKSLVTMLNSPRNGQNDIYWMKADFIDSLKAIKY